MCPLVRPASRGDRPGSPRRRAGSPRRAQAPVTAADYARAEKFLAAAVTPLVVGGSVAPPGFPTTGSRYRNTTADGAEFILVDPVKKTRVRAFDHEKLAAALSAAAGGTFDALKLPFQTDRDVRGREDRLLRRRDAALVVRRAGQRVHGGRRGRRGDRGAAGGRGGGPAAAIGSAVTSPDGKRAVFIRDWNLWVRDVATGRRSRSRTDGVKDFGYATDNAGWTTQRPTPSSSGRPTRRRSRRFQQDERKVGDMYLVNTTAGHPMLTRLEVPAARRQRRRDDPPRRHRRGRPARSCGSRCRPTSTARRSATT